MKSSFVEADLLHWKRNDALLSYYKTKRSRIDKLNERDKEFGSGIGNQLNTLLPKTCVCLGTALSKLFFCRTKDST